MAGKKVSFTTADGKKVSFTAKGKKKRKNPRRKLNPWQKHVKNNLRDVMDEYGVDAPEAMQILAEEYHG